MHRFYKILLCSGVNFKKWIITPRIYVIFAIMIIFEYYAFSTIPQIAAYYGVNASPWVFPFFLGNPSMFIIIGSMTALFYCNAPFADRHMPFLVIRTGQRNWIIGQLLYIYFSSFLYTACLLVLSVVMLIPRIHFTTDWGTLLNTITQSPIEVMEQVGVNIGFLVNDEMLALLSPIEATVLAFVMFWLVTAFIGVLVCSFNIVIGKMSGIIAAGVFTCIAYFSAVLGAITIGRWLLYISPISWSCISYLDWYGTGNVPSPVFAIISLLGTIILLSLISVIVFCKKDLDIQKGDF